MSINEILQDLQKIQTILLNFLDEEDKNQESPSNFDILNEIIKNYNHKYQIQLFLNLLSKTSKNFHRGHGFSNKIKQIVLLLKDKISQYFTNSEIFNIFKRNKMILLMLIDESILQVDAHFVIQMTNHYTYSDSPNYFKSEFKLIVNEDFLSNYVTKQKPHVRSKIRDYFKYHFSDNVPDDFDEKRHIYENDSFICELIRNDSIDDFIIYVQKNDFSLRSKIKNSIYETNPLLDKQKDFTLIEYASFFGSIRIFKYLISKGIELTPSLWLFAIHGKNAEIIQSLEDKKIEPENQSYNQCLIEAIKCHHNDIANYIRETYLSNNEDDDDEFNYLCIKYYNFELLENNSINLNYFVEFCQYGYYDFVVELLKCPDLDINKMKKRQNSEKNAIFAAVERENIEIVKLLLNNDSIDINILSKDDYTSKGGFQRLAWTTGGGFREVYEKSAFFLAVEKENIEIIKLFVNNQKLNINVINKITNYNNAYDWVNNITALYEAVLLENIEIIKLLFTNNQIDINALNEDENIKPSYGPRYDKITAFFMAIINKNIEIIKLFLSNDKLDVNALNSEEYSYNYRKTALCYTIEKGDIEIVKLLLEHKNIDVNVINEDDIDFSRKSKITPFFAAVNKKNVEIVKLLLENEKVDVNILNDHCCYEDDWFLFKQTALFRAVELDNIEIVKLILNCRKPDVNTICTKKYANHNYTKYDEYEKTVIHEAVEKENIEVIKLLLKIDGIDLNFINKIYIRNPPMCSFINYEKTVLYIAVESQNIDVVKLLLENKIIDPNILCKYRYRHLDKDNIENDDEITCLFKAVEIGNIDIVKLLLEDKRTIKDKKSSFWTKKNKTEKSPLDEALEKDKKDIIQLLSQ